MKRLCVPALALGLACVLAKPVSAGLLDGLHGNKCGDPCKPACEPACPKPCKLSCPKPCAPACPKPCDPCGGHKFGSRLKGMFDHFGHRDKCCEPCGSGEVIEHAGRGDTTFDYTSAPRLTPVPSNTARTTTARTTTRAYGN